MKRSDMIEILAQLIYDNQYFDGHHYCKILKGLEEAGMLPPDTNYFMENKPDGFVQTWDEISDYHRWEPEDETK